jgi:hypothetical protein
MTPEFPDVFEGMPVVKFMSLRQHDDFCQTLVDRQISFKTRVLVKRNRPVQFMVILLSNVPHD